MAREVTLPSPHTTEHAGPHEAVQAGEGSESQRARIETRPSVSEIHWLVIPAASPASGTDATALYDSARKWGQVLQ